MRRPSSPSAMLRITSCSAARLMSQDRYPHPLVQAQLLLLSIFRRMTPWHLDSNTTLTSSLERRRSSRTFRYGYLVTTSPQSSDLPSAAPSFSGWVTDFGHFRLPWCDGRCVQDPGTYSPRHSDPRLLAIPASCSRVADYNPN